MKKAFILSAMALAPALAFAQELRGFKNLLESIGDLVAMALPIVIGLILLAFFWGLAKFVFAAGNEEAKSEGKKLMIWGVIALFVAVSVWGLVRFLGNSLNVDTNTTTTVPTVPGL